MPAIELANLATDRTVKAVGSVVYAESSPLRAPLTERPCAVYEVTVLRWTPGGTGKSEVFRESDGHPFFIEDPTSRALVEAGSEVDLVLTVDRFHELEWLEPPDERVESFLHSRRIVREEAESLRIREAIVEEGELVSVCGWCRREGDPRVPAGYRTQPGRFVISGTETRPLLISDDPRTMTKTSE